MSCAGVSGSASGTAAAGASRLSEANLDQHRRREAFLDQSLRRLADALVLADKYSSDEETLVLPGILR